MRIEMSLLMMMWLITVDQPFYHVLVDNRDRHGDESTYVAEENIRVLPCVVRAPCHYVCLCNSRWLVLWA